MGTPAHTALLGRGVELAALAARLERRRLVTLVGPGGIGKTALARSVADCTASAQQGKWRLADLTRVSAPEAVDGEIARQFGAPTLAELADLPVDQPVLLVVDNCEHVLDAAANAVTTVLEALPDVRVLATSRSPLDLPAESIIAIGPLEVGPAAELFRERAADAGATLADDQSTSVNDLVTALDGLPLAIELAAARTRTLTPSEIVARLGDLDTLSRPRSRGPDRHRSVRAAVDWSYAQLGPPERHFFDRLSVVQGSFDAELAHAVAAEPGVTPAASRATLETLVENSLLVATPDDPGARGTMRYRHLATLRAVAADHLAAAGATETTRERLHCYLTDWAVDYLRRVEFTGEVELAGELLGMYDHIAEALRRTVAGDAEPERSMVLLGALQSLLWGAHAGDVRALGRRVFERWPRADPVPYALAVSTIALCEFLLGDAPAARALAQRALPAATPCGLASVRLQRIAADTAWTLGDTESARECFEAMAATARAAGMLPFALAAEAWIGFVRVRTGERAEGLAGLRKVRTEASARGLVTAELRALNAEAFAIVRDDAHEAERIARELHDRSAAAASGGNIAGLEVLSATAIMRGDHATAARHLMELIDASVGRGATHELRSALTCAAVLLERVGDPNWAGISSTARALPVLALCSTPGHEPVPAPPTHAVPLPVGEAARVARAALARIGSEVPLPAGPARARFAPEGDHWRVEYAGRAVPVRSSKGMADLAYLLARPGQEVHCLELAGAGVDEAPLGHAIDAKARREYETRIRELQIEIDAAEADHDVARADLLQAEFDALVEHLATALGLGGRARGRAGTTAERARSAVTQRIRAAIKRIEDVHPELARHLDVSISTGTFCVYRTEYSSSGTAVQWDTGAPRRSSATNAT